MQIDVYHVTPYSGRLSAQDTVDPKTLVKVARVECSDPEEAFHDTNHIDSNWTENPSVTLAEGVTRARSTSVGDVMHLVAQDTWLVVDGVGMKEIANPF